MKKLALLISMSLLTLTACSDDDNNDNKTINSNPSIVGIWKLEKAETLDGKNLTKVLGERKASDCDKEKGSIEFTDNKMIINKVSFENNECNVELVTHEYSKTDKTIEVLGEENLDIVELTNSTLVIRYYEADVNNDDVIDYAKITLIR